MNAMSKTGEKLDCTHGNCPDGQYCYETSKRCISYMVCSVYNRVEAETPARRPQECGPCMKGYIADVFSKIEEPVCHKIDDVTVNPIIFIISGIVIFMLLIFVAIYFNFDKVKNCVLKCFSCNVRQSIDINQNNATIVNIDEAAADARAVASVASAPEQSTFIRKTNCVALLPNNKETIVQDHFQNAVPCCAPNYMHTNYHANVIYPNNYEINVPEENHRRNTIQTNGNIEVIDPSSSPLLSEPCSTITPNDSANEDNSSFQQTNEQSFRDEMKNVLINQLFNQNITMTINVPKTRHNTP